MGRVIAQAHNQRIIARSSPFLEGNEPLPPAPRHPLVDPRGSFGRGRGKGIKAYLWVCFGEELQDDYPRYNERNADNLG
jgi:hypothetical protein